MKISIIDYGSGNVNSISNMLHHLGIENNITSDTCTLNKSDNKYLEKDIRYFLKKMKWDQKRLKTYLNQPEIKHDKYLSEKKLWDALASLYKLKNLIFKKQWKK